MSGRKTWHHQKGQIASAKTSLRGLQAHPNRMMKLYLKPVLERTPAEAISPRFMPMPIAYRFCGVRSFDPTPPKGETPDTTKTFFLDLNKNYTFTVLHKLSPFINLHLPAAHYWPSGKDCVLVLFYVRSLANLTTSEDGRMLDVGDWQDSRLPWNKMIFCKENLS